MLKIIITTLYWIMNIIRYIIITPIFMCKYLIVFIHYVADIGLCFSLFNPKETYRTFKVIEQDIENDDFYLITLFFVFNVFLISIPLFIIRHIYFTWLFIKDKYYEFRGIENE